MTVQLVLDTYGIDKEDALIVEANESSVTKTRNLIDQNLKSKSGAKIRVRLTNNALFSRFRDFEGLTGVMNTQVLIPRHILSDLYKTELPIELTNQLIVKLGLLNSDLNQISKDIDLADKVLLSSHKDFLSPDLDTFLKCLKELSTQAKELFNLAFTRTRLYIHLKGFFGWTDEVCDLFTKLLNQFNSAETFLNKLAIEQHQEHLRQLLNRYTISFPLPARTMPPSLLALPTLTLSEDATGALLEKWLRTLDEIARRVERKELNGDAIAELLVSPWPSVIDEISSLSEKDSCFITDNLVAKLISLQTPESNALASSLSEKLKLKTYNELPDQSTVDQMLSWSKGYFESILQSFSSNQDTHNDLSKSFAHWLIKQKPRIERSQHDWRILSQSIHDYLSNNFLVVICMVDALSALHQDLLDEALRKVEHLQIDNDVLFAPLPTLTEVCKTAILTGIEVSKQSSDPETTVRTRYREFLSTADSLKIIKSWSSANEHIRQETQLLIYYENRIDERLHYTADFNKHRKDVAAILGQLADNINRWRKDASHLNKEVVVIITADHGMTLTRSYYDGVALGETKERVFKVNAPLTNVNDDFVYIKSGDTGAGYLAPYSRIGLTKNALLSHGGLTPEEVVIPFVTLLSSDAKESVDLLEINHVNSKCIRLAHNTWQIEIDLSARTTINNIQIRLDQPFEADPIKFDTILRKNTQRVPITFHSCIEQSGLIEIVVRISYENNGKTESAKTHIPCTFAESLIEEDMKTKGFEDMFR